MPADVIDSFKQNEITHASLLQHVPVETIYRRRAEAAKDGVATEAHVHHRHARRGRVSVKPLRLAVGEDVRSRPPSRRGCVSTQALRQDIGPAIIAIRSRAAPVRDGVAKHHNGLAGMVRLNFDPGDQIPMRGFLRVRQARRGNRIARHNE